MKCWICKKWVRWTTRLWLDRGFRDVCESCRTTRISRDAKPYGNTTTLNLTNPAE